LLDSLACEKQLHGCRVFCTVLKFDEQQKFILLRSFCLSMFHNR
jgi:hypothetical protein